MKAPCSIHGDGYIFAILQGSQEGRLNRPWPGSMPMGMGKARENCLKSYPWNGTSRTYEVHTHHQNYQLDVF